MTAVPGIEMVPLHLIDPCPIQPRVNVSVDLVRQMAASIRSGRHEPLLEVEPSPLLSGRYQIVCGEQRWRAAREAGLKEVVVRVNRRLGVIERLQKQYEENRLRKDLDPIEEAQLLLFTKTVRDAEVAEGLLRDAEVHFQPLDERPITERAQVFEHLETLKALLVEHEVRVGRSGGHLLLSAWHETEQALGISETTRKAKVGILRLPASLHETVRQLPAEHAVQISRVADTVHQQELAARASEVNHQELRRVVDLLRRNPELTVDQALDRPALPAQHGDPISFDAQVLRLLDLSRQLARLLRNLQPRISKEQHQLVVEVLRNVGEAADVFQDVG